jgi:hypothetical protein
MLDKIPFNFSTVHPWLYQRQPHWQKAHLRALAEIHEINIILQISKRSNFQFSLLQMSEDIL